MGPEPNNRPPRDLRVSGEFVSCETWDLFAGVPDPLHPRHLKRV
jgi:hypothetical protein